MKHLLEYLSTRELALLIWVTIFLLFVFLHSKIRDSAIRTFKALIAWRILVALSAMIVYLLAIAYLLKSLNLLHSGFLKDHFFWFFTVALILFFKVNKAANNNWFTDILKGSLKWSIILEFLINFYTFSLFIELLIIPFAVLLEGVQAYAEIYNNKERSFDQVLKVIKGMLSFIGICVLIYILYKTANDFEFLFSYDNLKALMYPLLLTITFIPYLYALALVMQYEAVLTRIKFMTSDTEKQRELKEELLKIANVSLNRLLVISKGLNKYDFSQSTSVKIYYKNLIDNKKGL